METWSQLYQFLDTCAKPPQGCCPVWSECSWVEMNWESYRPLAHQVHLSTDSPHGLDPAIQKSEKGVNQLLQTPTREEYCLIVSGRQGLWDPIGGLAGRWVYIQVIKRNTSDHLISLPRWRAGGTTSSLREASGVLVTDTLSGTGGTGCGAIHPSVGSPGLTRRWQPEVLCFRKARPLKYHQEQQWSPA